MEEAQVPSCIIVIFGASGDLASRMLFPAIYHLLKSNHLPKNVCVVGTARAQMSDEEFREKIRDSLSALKKQEILNASISESLIQHSYFYSLDSSKKEGYASFKNYLENLDHVQGTQGNILFYLSTPPALFPIIPNHLSEQGLLSQTDPSWRRVIFEKPFGTDLKSAIDLNKQLRTVLQENQIYRIDHYLGKETVQNIMALRFANGIFEPIWNRRYVSSVQITVAETLGIEDRGEYFDHAGTMRDMVPNHLFQVLSMIGMEPPNSFDADDVRNEKVKLIQAIQPFDFDSMPNRVVRGQYNSGHLGHSLCAAYREESHVSPQSTTETYVALQVEIDNWRWAGVPFYLRTGKRLSKRMTQVVIEFNCAPFQMFQKVSSAATCSNMLILQIQPEERIQLRISAKIPGPEVRLGPVLMDFNYVDAFGKAPSTGYETLLFDCIKGDSTLFQRVDQVESAWQVVDPILQYWQEARPIDFPNYRAGTWGPRDADQLLLRHEKNWFNNAFEIVTSQPIDRRAA